MEILTLEKPKEQAEKRTRERLTYYGVPDILAMKYDTLGFDGEWRKIFGDPPADFMAIIYAAAKLGKSHLATELAAYLASKVGPTVYISVEEGVGFSVQRRLQRLNLQDCPNLRFLDTRSKKDVMKVCHTRGVRAVIIDSPAALKLTAAEVEKLQEDMKGKKVLILIQHVNNSGDVKGGTEWLHLVDVIVEMDDKHIHSRGRFDNEDKVARKPYKPQPQEAQQAMPV